MEVCVRGHEEMMAKNNSWNGVGMLSFTSPGGKAVKRSPGLNVEVLILNVMVFGGGVLERSLGLDEVMRVEPP